MGLGFQIWQLYIPKAELFSVYGQLISAYEEFRHPTIEYNLFWNGKLIRTNPRNFVKQYNQIKYKGDMLALELFKIYSSNLHLNIIDWKMSYDIIMKEFKGEN